MQIKCTLNTRSLILELICQCLQRQVVPDLWPVEVGVWLWYGFLSGFGFGFGIGFGSAPSMVWLSLARLGSIPGQD